MRFVESLHGVAQGETRVAYPRADRRVGVAIGPKGEDAVALEVAYEAAVVC